MKVRTEEPNVFVNRSADFWLKISPASSSSRTASTAFVTPADSATSRVLEGHQDQNNTDFPPFCLALPRCLFFTDRRRTAPAALTPSIPTPAAAAAPPPLPWLLEPAHDNTSTDSRRSNNGTINIVTTTTTISIIK